MVVGPRRTRPHARSCMKTAITKILAKALSGYLRAFFPNWILRHRWDGSDLHTSAGKEKPEAGGRLVRDGQPAIRLVWENTEKKASEQQQQPVKALAGNGPAAHLHGLMSSFRPLSVWNPSKAGLSAMFAFASEDSGQIDDAAWSRCSETLTSDLCMGAGLSKCK